LLCRRAVWRWALTMTGWQINRPSTN